MTSSHSTFLATFAAAGLIIAAAGSPAFAQQVQPSLYSDVSTCILAGRLSSEGRWAPLASGITLLDAKGKPLARQGKAALESAKAVVLTTSALLAQCNGNQALPSGESSAGSKSPAPALSAGSAPIPITAVAYAPIRAGGQWVELKLDVPLQRVVMLAQ